MILAKAKAANLRPILDAKFSNAIRLQTHLSFQSLVLNHGNDAKLASTICPYTAINREQTNCSMLPTTSRKQYITIENLHE